MVMRYQLKNQIYSLNDNLSASALVVGFAKKVTIDELLSNLNLIKEKVPILNSKLVKSDESEYFFDDSIMGFDYKIENCENVNKWITTQYNIPLDLYNGEFLRLAINNQDTLVIFAHQIISDSRGLINFAKALLSSPENYDFEYCDYEEKKINFIAQLKANKLKKIVEEEPIKLDLDKIKVKKISLKSSIVYSLCSGHGISLLSFFVTVALSLSKAVRKDLVIPFCKKENENSMLSNGTSLIKFKRGLEPRLSFYDNCAEIDKLLKSFLKRQPHLTRDAILNQIPNDMKAKSLNNEHYFKFLSSDMLFDVLPTIDNDEVLTTLSYYPSSSFIENSFGISIIDDKVTICTILHDAKSQDLFNDYQKTINLISKNSDLVIK